MQTDNQLIRRIKKKQDKKAADELIRRYYREIYAFTYRQTGERELALDLTQEIFITVLQGIYAFDAFQDTHLILSVRQEQEHMQVRYYSSKPEEHSRSCTPNLEDVFLVTYQEEPA